MTTWVTARYEAPGGVRKVGRTPKVYEPSDMDIRISIPPREHDLLAAILVDAVLASPGDAHEAALTVAREHGERIGASERARTRPGRLGAERAMTLASEVLQQHGFEPAWVNPTCVQLRNCPFHPLAARHPDSSAVSTTHC